MPYFEILMMVCCATAYYRIGRMEYDRGFLICVLSLALWLVTWLWLGWAVLPCIGAQLSIFVGMTVFNVLRKP